MMIFWSRRDDLAKHNRCSSPARFAAVVWKVSPAERATEQSFAGLVLAAVSAVGALV